MKNVKLHFPKKITPYGHLAIFFFFFYMTQTTGQYLQIYLYGIGFTKTQIGLITGTAGLLSLGFQPILGGMADAAKSKKGMLAAVTAISAVAFPAMYFGKSIIPIFLFYTAYQLFFSFAITLNTSLSVEYCQMEDRPFGPLRMLGALSYSLMMFVIGAATGKSVNTIFVIFPVACVIALACIPAMPDVKGGNNRRSGLKQISPLTLMKNKKVVVFVAFQVLISVAMGISDGFFSIYFTDDMHGSTQLYGTNTAVAAMLEMPFLLLTDRWLAKMGPRKMLMLLCSLTALRYLLFFLATSVSALFFARCLNCFMVMQMTTSSLILARIVSPQLRTSVQTLSSSAQSVARMVVSSYLGGFLADQVGIRPLFGVSAVMMIAIAVVFTQVVFKGLLDD